MIKTVFTAFLRSRWHLLMHVLCVLGLATLFINTWYTKVAWLVCALLILVVMFRMRPAKETIR